jgi:hypothetical protein
MSDPTSLPPATDGTESDQRLTERVIARIRDARRDIQVRSRTSQAKGRTRRGGDGDARALRRVFLDLGESYRNYRRRTGEPVAPEVRDAALRFRRDLDLRSLVSVAASLERLDHELIG